MPKECTNYTLLYKQLNLVIHLSFIIALWIWKEKTEKWKRLFFVLFTNYINSCKCDLQLLSEFEKRKPAIVDVFLTYIIFFLCVFCVLLLCFLWFLFYTLRLFVGGFSVYSCVVYQLLIIWYCAGSSLAGTTRPRKPYATLPRVRRTQPGLIGALCATFYTQS